MDDTRWYLWNKYNKISLDLAVMNPFKKSDENYNKWIKKDIGLITRLQQIQKKQMYHNNHDGNDIETDIKDNEKRDVEKKEEEKKDDEKKDDEKKDDENENVYSSKNFKYEFMIPRNVEQIVDELYTSVTNAVVGPDEWNDQSLWQQHYSGTGHVFLREFRGVVKWYNRETFNHGGKDASDPGWGFIQPSFPDYPQALVKKASILHQYQELFASEIVKFKYYDKYKVSANGKALFEAVDVKRLEMQTFEDTINATGKIKYWTDASKLKKYKHSWGMIIDSTQNQEILIPQCNLWIPPIDNNNNNINNNKILESVISQLVPDTIVGYNIKWRPWIDEETKIRSYKGIAYNCYIKVKIIKMN